MSKLSRLSWLERRKLNKVLKPVGHGLSNPKTRQVAVVKSIRLLKDATQQKMQEWVYWYTLGDFLLEAGFVDEGLRVCSFCYHLRPDDPRSTYGLASAFRQLSDARLMGKPGIAEAIANGKRAGQWVPNPEASKAALARIGLTVDEAASAAIYFFMKTLGLVTGKDDEMVRNHLAALLAAFPELTPEVTREQLVEPLRYIQTVVNDLDT